MTEVKRTVKQDGPTKGEIRYEHPAYGQISITRQTGGNCVLYGSRLRHNHTVCLKICRSLLERHLYHDTYYAESLPIIEVHMSSVQFAEMLTNMNTTGVPCTIHALDKKPVAPPDPIETIVEAFNEDLEETTLKVRRLVAEAQKVVTEMMEGKTLKKGDLEKVRSALWGVEADLSSNLKFMHDSFVNAMEDGVQRAKAEFDAHVLHVAQEIGFEKLREMAPSMSDPVRLGDGGRGAPAGAFEEDNLISGTQKIGANAPEGEE